jgi:hypothetical protein
VKINGQLRAQQQALAALHLPVARLSRMLRADEKCLSAISADAEPRRPPLSPSGT